VLYAPDRRGELLWPAARLEERWLLLDNAERGVDLFPPLHRRYARAGETFHTEDGEVSLLDCFASHADGEHPYSQLIRVVEGVRGHAELDLRVLPRFDYGEVRPWLRQEGVRVYSAIGGNDGLLISSDAEISPLGNHDLKATVNLRAGERIRLSLMAVPPELRDLDPPEAPDPEELDHRLEEALEWWRQGAAQAELKGPSRSEILRSAMVLKALTYEPTGAILAAATTSLPESPGGDLNWDYRYSWVRDSSFFCQRWIS
jgi:GH15 family glucan-1,4-alpha-glucosidase